MDNDNYLDNYQYRKSENSFNIKFIKKGDSVMNNEESKQIGESSGSSEYEYAFEAVPESKRKTLLSLFFVLAGYPIALSNFVTGGAVGIGMRFKDMLLTLLVGNGILMSIVIVTGYIAYEHGLSTTFLSRKAFGKKGSSIFSVILAISGTTWVAINGDTFARLIKTTFSWWPIPVSITAILVIIMWMQSAIRGYDGLEFISFLGVPAAIIVSIIGVVAVGIQSNGFSGIFDYIPKEPMSFTAATASIVGSWVFGATMTPDVCRFAKKKSHVFIAGIGSFFIGCFGLQLAGALIAVTTGQGDFIIAMAALGLSLIAFIGAIFCLWTTQDNNIYGASLALQNVIKETSLAGKVSHKKLALMISSIASILAAFGIYSHILPIVQALSVLIAPVPGLIMAEMLFVKNSKENKEVNSLAIIAWLLGGVAGYISLKKEIFVSAIVGIAVTMIAYLILSKMFDKTINKN